MLNKILQKIRARRSGAQSADEPKPVAASAPVAQPAALRDVDPAFPKRLGPIQTVRVPITYDAEIGNAIVKRELPFVIGVLADLSGGRAEPLSPLEFVEIDRDNFDQVLESVHPRLDLRVPCRLQEDGGASQLHVVLSFRSLEDFSPAAVASQIPGMSVLLSIRTGLGTLPAALLGSDQLDDVLHKFLDHPELLENTVRDIAVLKNPLRPSALGEAVEVVNARLASIDHAMSRQMDEIMHHPDFQRLEATWRGLHYLVVQAETSSSLRIKVLNTTKRELLADLASASEFEQSHLFKQVYEQEYCLPDGNPFGALVGDYDFGCGPEDLDILEKISNIAATAHAPFISAAGPDMFGLKDFTELVGSPNLAKIFDNDLYVRWKSFRESENSQYVGLVMPRVLLRLPYGKDSIQVDEFHYEEKVDGKDHSKYLWGNAAYVFAARLTNAFDTYGWCVAICGKEGGQVEGLPTHTFATGDGNVASKGPTEQPILHRREFDLAELGFIALLLPEGADQPVFNSAHSAHKPAGYLDDDRNTDALLSTQLQYLMMVSRFAHYLKKMMLDYICSFMSRSDCELYLNRWLSSYVLADESAGPRKRAKFPLKYGKVEISELSDRPGEYRALLEVQPLLQFAELVGPLRASVMLKLR